MNQETTTTNATTPAGLIRWTPNEQEIFKQQFEWLNEDMPFQERVTLAQAQLPEDRRRKFGGPSCLPWASKAYREGRKTSEPRSRAKRDAAPQATRKGEPSEASECNTRTTRKIAGTKRGGTKRADAASYAVELKRPVDSARASTVGVNLLESAIGALVDAIVSRVESMLAARLAAVGNHETHEKHETGSGNGNGTAKNSTGTEAYATGARGVRAMSDQQLRDRIGLARARGDLGEVKSCVNELKRRDGIANRFAVENEGGE